MRIRDFVQHAPRAIVILGSLTFLSLCSQLVTVWKLNTEQYLGSSSILSSTLSSLQSGSYSSQPPKVGRVYMHYGSGAEESGIPLDGYYNESMRLHLAYDSAHGYPSYVLRSDVYEGVWNKVVYIATIIAEQLMKPESERLEWLIWTDRDIILMNPLVPCDIFLPPSDFSSTQLLISRDFQALNAGIFFLRVSKWSYDFMTQVIAYRAFSRGESLMWFEQSAMIALIARHPDYLTAGLVRYMPQNWFNAYVGPRSNKTGEFDFEMEPEYNYTRHGGKGVMMLHFAGPVKAKMGLFLRIAARSDKAWEVPLRETNYAREIEEFWEEDRRKHDTSIDNSR